jgi:subtilisin family serine protease
MNKLRLFFSASMLLALGVLVGSAVQAAENVAGASLVRTAADKTDRVRVIARLSRQELPPAGFSPGPVLDALQNTLRKTMELEGVTYIEPVARTALTVLEVDRRQLDSLLDSGLVEAVQIDQIDQAYLADSVPLIRAPGAWDQGARGAGWSIAILDTGVDAAHSFLGGRVVAEACFSSDSPTYGATPLCPNGETSQIGAGAGTPCTIEGCDHGTHVAGIAAGKGGDFSGVAPDASIIAIQVFSKFEDQPGGPEVCSESGIASPCVLTFLSDQIRALQHVRELASQHDIAAVNMSLGGGEHKSPCDTDFRKEPIDELRALGIATVIASGNESYEDAVGAPGCISTAVTVGCTTKSDSICTFSNSSEQVDLLAPGSQITASVPGGDFQSMSGTSMSTPHVAGAFAVLRSGLSDATVDEVETRLVSTGTGITDTRNGLRKPRIDVLPALVGETQVSACSLCYDCGGDWPVFGGAIPIRITARPWTRGAGCSGELEPRADSMPYLCCRPAP